MNEEQQSTRRRPRKIKRQPEQQAEILQEQSKDNDEDSHSLKNDKPETASQSRPSQSCNRRRPKKLPREASATDSQAFEIEMKKQGQSEISDEIMSLKTRVEDIERQVREISTSRKGPTKSSRRRLRRTKSTTEGDTEADELVNLQGDLVEATKELEALQAEPQAIKDEETQREDTDVEEILRHDDNMAFEQESPRLDKQRRSVALSGSYRFNLPQVMSDSDIQAVQTGIHGIQNIARKFVNEHSSQGTARESMTQQGSRSDEGWSSWFGGYSLSIARFVGNVNVGNSLEEEHQHTAATVEPRRRPRKLRIRNDNLNTLHEGYIENSDSLRT